MLERVRYSSTQKIAVFAEHLMLIVLSLLERGRHWILVVLLLGNVVGIFFVTTLMGLSFITSDFLLDCQRVASCVS